MNAHTELVGWQLADAAYPPRFSTLEAAQKAMQGDYSGVELPFEEKDYGPPVGKTIMLRKAYKDAPYEMRILK